MAGRPLKRKREIRDLIHVLYDRGFEDDDWNRFYELAAMDAKRRGKKNWPKFTPETAAQAREKIRKKSQMRKQAFEEGYLKAIEEMAPKAAMVQLIALQKAYKHAVGPDGEVDLSRVSNKDLALAVKVASEIADRHVGKATQRIEAKVEQSVWDELDEAGELDE